MKRVGLDVASWAPNRLDVFGTGRLGHTTLHKFWDGSDWLPKSGWEDLGGRFASAPVGVAWGPNRLDVFGVGDNAHVYHKRWDGAGWRPQASWNDLGGDFASAPAVAAWGPDRLDLVALGRDRQMFHKAWDGSDWRPRGVAWEPHGAAFSSAPTIVSWGPNRLDIFALGTDRRLYHQAWDGTQWLPRRPDGSPSQTNWDGLGGPFKAFNVASWGPGRLDIFAVGTDGQMRHKAWDTDWRPPANHWTELGGNFTSRPALASWAPGRMDVFAVGSDGQMHHKAWDGDWKPSQQDWAPFGGLFTSAPEAVAWGRDRLDVFAVGTTRQMYHKAWDGSRWRRWEPLEGSFRPPAAVVTTPPPPETRWAVLLCRFMDDASEPLPRIFYEKLFTPLGSGLQNMVDYFDATSHGQVDHGGTDVLGWFTLNQNRRDYTGSGSNPQGRQDLLAWARQAATSAGVNLASYSGGIVVAMNVPTDLFGGRDGVVCDIRDLQPSILGHEMGHGYGLNHSRVDGSTDPYQDPWDTMSVAEAYIATSPDFGRIGPGLNALNMRMVGWLEERRVWTLPNGVKDATLNLAPLHRRDLPGWLAAELPGTPDKFMAELRVREGWDAAIPRDTVVIHRRDASGFTYLMRASSTRLGMGAGDVFTAPAPGSTTLEVTVQELGDHKATLNVRLTP